MLRAAIRLLTFVGLSLHGFLLLGQNALPASLGSHAAPNLLVGSGESRTRTLELEGKITSVEGEPLEGAIVWVASFASPTQHLAEVHTNGLGSYSLKAVLPFQPQAAGPVVVGADHSEFIETRELIDLSGPVQASKMTLLLRRQDDSLDAPSLDLIEAWLMPRLARSPACHGRPAVSCKTLEATLTRLRKNSTDWAALQEILQETRQSDLPEFRLFAALALMRMGSWEGAGRVLASSAQTSDPSEYEFLLRGVRWNFLRKPEEARGDLEQAEAMDPRNALIDLEMGRAAVQAENWSAAAEKLERPLRDRKLAPHARYLRARALLALGDFEGASVEAGLLTKDVRKKRLPPGVQGFTNDLQRRLQERSVKPLESVMLQSVPELKEAVSELKDLDPASPPPPGGLEEFLKNVGITVEATFRDFSNTAATEIIRQTQLDRTGKPRSARAVECSYVFVNNSYNGHPEMEEYRGNKDGQQVGAGTTDGGFMATSGFVASLIILHPEFQSRTSYRFLGSEPLEGQLTYVIGFAQKPGASPPLGRFILPQGNVTTLYLQGIAWISAQYQVLRLRTDLLHPVAKIALRRDSSEIDYRPYHFLSSPTTLLLPSRVTVSVEYGAKRLRNEHVLSKFQLFNVDVHEDAASRVPLLNAAHQTFRVNPNNDNVHVNLGLALDNKGDLEAAIQEYREALRVNPNNDIAHHNLGLALDDKGDLEEAIGEYREALRLNPNYEDAHNNLASALYKKGKVEEAIAEYREGLRLNPENDSAHYNLGIALGAKGTLDGAIAETRTAVRLNPNNSQSHYSLAFWLEKDGDRQGALGEYRKAYTLNPDNTQFKRAYERLTQKPKSRRSSGPAV